MLNRILTVALLAVAGFALLGSTDKAPPPAVAAPINPSPGNVAAMEAEIARLEQDNAMLRAGFSGVANELDELKASLKPDVAPAVPTQPVAAPVAPVRAVRQLVAGNCAGGACSVQRAAERPRVFQRQRGPLRRIFGR